jgi:CMP/dCMP kinase
LAVSKPLIVAIDGPSGAGKGTVARAVAARLGYRHVDTGAMYRAVAWKAAHDRVDLTDDAAVAAVGERAAFDLEQGRIVIDGHDVASAIRTAEIDKAAAIVARHPGVRRVLVARQRALGGQGGVVMEGRDIGTVVFPDAPVKVFLTASDEMRAARRALDEAGAERQMTVDEVAADLARRDALDSNRTVSPLAVADDAIVVDNTARGIDEVVDEIVRRAEAAFAAAGDAT